MLGSHAYVGPTTLSMIDNSCCSGPDYSYGVFEWTPTRPDLECMYEYINFITVESNLKN